MAASAVEEQVSGFIDKYTPEIGAIARDALDRLRARIPGAVEIVYDNYNALAIGFSPTDRTGDVVISIALYPRWVSIFFMKAVGLQDPDGLLKGGGKVCRHIVLETAADLDKPAIADLIAAAVSRSDPPFMGDEDARMIVKSISAKQRPRRPDGA